MGLKLASGREALSEVQFLNTFCDHTSIFFFCCTFLFFFFFSLSFFLSRVSFFVGRGAWQTCRGLSLWYVWGSQTSPGVVWLVRGYEVLVE